MAWSAVGPCRGGQPDATPHIEPAGPVVAVAHLQESRWLVNGCGRSWVYGSNSIEARIASNSAMSSGADVESWPATTTKRALSTSTV